MNRVTVGAVVAVVALVSAGCEELAFRTTFGKPCAARSDCDLVADELCLNGACTPPAPFEFTASQEPVIGIRGRTLDVRVPVRLSPGRAIRVVNIQPPEATITLEDDDVRIVWPVPAVDNGPLQENISADLQDADTSRGLSGFSVTVRTFQPPGAPCANNDVCVDGVCVQRTPRVAPFCAPAAPAEGGCAADEFETTLCDTVPCRQVCLARRLLTLQAPGDPCGADSECHFGRCVEATCADGDGHGAVAAAGGASCAIPLEAARFDDDLPQVFRCTQRCSDGICRGPGNIEEPGRCDINQFCRLRGCTADSDCAGLGACEQLNATSGRCVDGSVRAPPGGACTIDTQCDGLGPCVDGGGPAIDVCAPATDTTCGAGETATLWCDGAPTPGDCIQTCIALEPTQKAEGETCGTSSECRLGSCVASAPPTCQATAGPWSGAGGGDPLSTPGCAPPLVPFEIGGRSRCVDPCGGSGDADGCAFGCLSTTRVVDDGRFGLCAPIDCAVNACPTGMTCRVRDALDAQAVPSLPDNFCVID